MAITVSPKIDDKPEKDITITWHDAELIREIATKLDPIKAMRVTRWLADCSLRSAKDFVEGLMQPPQQ